MVIIMGKTKSGKTAIVEKLKKRGYNKVVTTTTRPIRKGEKPDVDYHFVTDKEFFASVENGGFAEWKSYATVDGVWFYGTKKEDIESAGDKSVIILTPDGVRDIKEHGIDSKVLYIYSNLRTIQSRGKSRGTSKKEEERRIAADNEDFKHVEELADKIFYNNKGTDLDKLVQKIVEYLEGSK